MGAVKRSFHWVNDIWIFVIPWTVAHQAPLSMEFSRQEYRLGWLFLLQGIFLIQGLNLGLLHCKQIFYHLSHKGSKWCQENLKGWIDFTKDRLSKKAFQTKEQNLHRFREEKAACGTFQIKVCHSMTETEIVPGERHGIHWARFLCALRSLDFILQKFLKDFKHRYAQWGLWFIKIIQGRAQGRQLMQNGTQGEKTCHEARNLKEPIKLWQQKWGRRKVSENIYKGIRFPG